jgi:hypothetical protein
MPRIPRAGLTPAASALVVSAALWLCTAVPAAAGVRLDPDPAWRHAGSLPALVAILEDWLDGATALPRRANPPALCLVSPAEARRLAGAPGRGLGPPRGLYDPETATIHLVRPWSRNDAHDVSVLLHELVYHRRAPLHHYCAAAREPAAYRLQSRWLAARGRALDWPRLAVTVAAGCARRDIHPGRAPAGPRPGHQ